MKRHPLSNDHFINDAGLLFTKTFQRVNSVFGQNKLTTELNVPYGL